jgi:hypothetical protein
MARHNSQESSGNGFEEAADAVAGAPNHLKTWPVGMVWVVLIPVRTRPMAVSFAEMMSGDLHQQRSTVHCERYPIDEAVAHQEQYRVGDFFGPADSPDGNPLRIHLDECVLALARELID